MKTMSYAESRARYAEVLDGVANDHEEVIITRAGHEPVVIVSLEDYESLREIAYLMRSPVNARRLLDALEQLEGGRGQAHELIDTDCASRQGRGRLGMTSCRGRSRIRRARPCSG